MERFSIQDRFEQKLKGKPAPVKKVYRIPTRSNKRVKEDRELKKLFIERFLIDPWCEVRSPVCDGLAVEFDHQQRTSPNNRLKPENLKMSCRACNSFRETAEGGKWEKETGYYISRFKK